ncbi:MAG: hypothetical protein DI536_32180 [Archangium gephyra]|uniref:Outer membrane protein beta-barrel domain-containing protein n=1 Tax=Archangium gephyra TaxID=48 RepID=A0A2W5SY07_9BACT|nr:MAG: hypothetical protein DI536_32180 [Archangium gephyra]
MSALALVLTAALAATAEGRFKETEVELSFATGYGGRVSLGGMAGIGSRWHAWGGQKLNGGIEVSLLAGYQNEPYSFTAARFLPNEITGSNHRVQALVTVGHGLRISRFTVGTHLFLGWTNLTVDGRLKNEALGIDELVDGSASELSFGFVLHARFRLTDRLSLAGRFFLPVPNFVLGVNSWFVGTLGLSVML